jgi:glutathione S-transferase
VNDKYKLDGLPADLAIRAVCRAAAAEMHSGFGNLRQHLPMNCRRTYDNFEIPAAAQADIARVIALWTECRAKHSDLGPWLFGAYSIADAMYTPVVLRFRTYRVPTNPEVAQYMQTVLDDAAVKEWVANALAETEVIEQEER